MPSTAATGGQFDIPCLSFTQLIVPFFVARIRFQSIQARMDIHLITNRALFRAGGECRNLTLKNAGRSVSVSGPAHQAQKGGKPTNLVSPFMRRLVVLVRSFMGPHTHADDGRRDLVRGQQPAASVRHSGVHTTFATAVTSAAFQGRRRRRRSIALPRPPSKLRESPSSPFSPSSFTLLCEEVTKERRGGRERGRDACNDDGAREDA